MSEAVRPGRRSRRGRPTSCSDSVLHVTTVETLPTLPHLPVNPGMALRGEFIKLPRCRGRIAFQGRRSPDTLSSHHEFVATHFQRRLPTGNLIHQISRCPIRLRTTVRRTYQIRRTPVIERFLSVSNFRNADNGRAFHTSCSLLQSADSACLSRLP